MGKIRVLLVDDHAIVREGLGALLELSPAVVVLGEAANGMEALEKVKKMRPDVVLMDLAMPVLDGIAATRRISQEFPATKVLALTQYDDREHVFEMIEAGAAGFINKSVASSELLEGIQAVSRGDSYLSPSVARYFVERVRNRPQDAEGKDPYARLTGREKEILKLLAEGYTSKEVADLLQLTPKTVDGHKTRLMAKLDLHNRADLVKYALRKGIINL